MTDQVSKEVFQIAGDPASGISATHDFTNAAIGHPVVLATIGDKPVLLTLDVYQGVEHEGSDPFIHVICPMCLAAGRRQALKIAKSRKAWTFELEPPPTWPGWSRVQMRAAIAGLLEVAPDRVPTHFGGRISVEPFACTWESDPLPGREYSFSRCPWKVAIDNNYVRSVR